MGGGSVRLLDLFCGNSWSMCPAAFRQERTGATEPEGLEGCLGRVSGRRILPVSAQTLGRNHGGAEVRLFEWFKRVVPYIYELVIGQRQDSLHAAHHSRLAGGMMM